MCGREPALPVEQVSGREGGSGEVMTTSVRAWGTGRVAQPRGVHEGGSRRRCQCRAACREVPSGVSGAWSMRSCSQGDHLNSAVNRPSGQSHGVVMGCGVRQVR